MLFSRDQEIFSVGKYLCRPTGVGMKNRDVKVGVTWGL